MMRSLWVSAIAAALIAGSAAAVDPPREPAPKFQGRSLDGEKFSSDTLKGKTVLVQFWTTWCSACQRDQPAVETMVREFTSRGLVVLAVNLDESRKDVSQYLRDSPRTCRIVLSGDTHLAAVFAPKSHPMYVLIDPQGNLAGSQTGSGGDDALRTLLRAAGLETK
jgi:thiol-disulfide isomerase/thioredoxin